MNIKTLLADMGARGATGLYLSAGNPPVFRVEGALYPAGGAPALTPQAIEALLEPHLTPGQRRAAWQSRGIGRVHMKMGDVTVEGEVFPDGDRLAAALHRIL